MTTEDDFRRALDTNPKDWQTLAVFSDWLRERGDERADGYAALGTGRFRPDSRDRTRCRWWEYGGPDANLHPGHLDRDWWHLLAAARDRQYRYAKKFRSVSAAFDAAALAFAKLPEERRAELLAVPTQARQKPTRAKPKKKPAKPKKLVKREGKK